MERKIGGMDAVLGVKDKGGKEVAEFFENADEHKRPIARGISGDNEKDKLPGEGDSGETVKEKRMCDRRRILHANFVEDEKQRRDDKDAPDGGDVEEDFGEFHGRSCEERLRITQRREQLSAEHIEGTVSAAKQN